MSDDWTQIPPTDVLKVVTFTGYIYVLFYYIVFISMFQFRNFGNDFICKFMSNFKEYLLINIPVYMQRTALKIERLKSFSLRSRQKH